MKRGPNLKDPRLKDYLDSLEPKYRKMLEDLYGDQGPNIKVEELREIVRKRAENSSDSGGG